MTDTAAPLPKAVLPEPRKVLFRLWGFDVHKPRTPGRYVRDASGGFPAFPLIVLFKTVVVPPVARPPP